MRFEYKYVIPNGRLETIRRDLLPFMVHDPYALREKNHQYTVRSIYFDTPRLDVYHEKIEGLHIRRKLRIRTYNQKIDGSTAFLEIKMKVNQRGMKHRAAVRSDDIPDFLRLKSPEQFVLTNGNPAVAQDRARRFLFHIIRASMSPVVLVTYEREAFLGRFDRTLRITLDRHLRFLPYPSWPDLYRERGLQSIAPSFFILEIKFDMGFAPWLQTIVNRHGLLRTSVSKYGTSIAACIKSRSMHERNRMERPCKPYKFDSETRN